MEELAKEPGHRASVSMPSLDATDDFPPQTSSTEDTDSAFVTTDATFVSTATTETIVSSSSHNDVLSTDTVSFSSVDTLSVEGEQPVQAQHSKDESFTEPLNNETNSETLTEGTATEPLIDESSTEALIDETSTEPLIEGAPTEPIIEESPTEPLIEGPSTEPLIEGTPSEELIDDVSTEHLIDGASTEAAIGESLTEPIIDSASSLLEEGSEVLHQEDILDDSQGEEDPSIAIDQFIKKIADEQLSSKRIEERKEEEANEQNQEAEGDNLDVPTETVEQDGSETVLGGNAAVEENVASESTMPEESETVKPSEEPSSLENTLTEENPPKSKETEPMEVDTDIHNAPTQQFNILEDGMAEKSLTDVMESEDHMQMESIEEIQKEIDKIPPKNPVNKEENTQESYAQNGTSDRTVNQNENHTQESIEQILGEDISQPAAPAGDILKNALNTNFKEPTIQDSSEVARDAQLIEKAQEEIRKLDVLVCGECHNTYYFAQEFLDHKKGRCPKKSILTGICENESKPQVWGFILWKIKQTKELGKNVPSSWSIYQRWCKLSQADKNAWITAGQSIQFASKIGYAKVTEVRPTRQTKQVVVHKVMDKQGPPKPIEFVDSNKENSSSMEIENTATNIIKKGISKPVRLNNDVTILPSTKKEEYVVEKIMAKRFNPRKKTWEYNIKWENFGHDSNTWEPIGNLSHCKIMLEQFEEQLKRMKEEKAKQAAQSPKGRGRPSNPKPNSANLIPIAPRLDSSTPKISNVVGGVSDDYAGGSMSRPTRSSKQNALSQLKQWCGSISDEDSGGGVGIKRKHESDDSDEDYDEKKIKMEEDSDYSDKETLKPKISIKKVTSMPKQIPVKNGNTGAQQVLPSNILIPDANGVVRINQKQLPSLSSGVYIMSKTAGIIKLDSTTSKVATSGGQTIVKVAPKIGQTQIKIVKKDGNTTKQIIQVSPKPIVTSTPVKVGPSKVNTSKFIPKIRKEIRKPPILAEPVSKIVLTPKKPEAPPTPAAQQDDESDDGLEPLPFPGPDEPIPDLDDNQGDDEFVLDPETGKIAGVEYVDKPVVIKEEPRPVPPSTSDLENIVKLAASEITNSDSQNSDSQMELDPLFTDDTEEDVKPKIVQQQVKSETRPSGSQAGVVRKVVKYTTAQGMKTETSILNKALTQGTGTPRAVISPVKGAAPVRVQERPRVVQQKVLNQMVSRTPMGISGQTRTVVRHVIGPQRPSAGGNFNVIRKTIAPAPKTKFNLSPQRPLASPLQPTRTYSAMGGIRQQSTGPGSKVQVYSTKNVGGNQSSSGVQGGVRRIGNTIVRTTSSAHQQNTVQKPQATQYTTQKQPITRIVQRVVTSPKKPETQNVIHRPVSQPQTKVLPTRPKAVINMPSLTDEDTPAVPTPKLIQKPQTTPAPQKVVPQLAKPAVKQEPPTQEDTPISESSIQTEASESATNAEQGTDWSSFTMADGDNPIYVTGDDGTIYQVAGQNEQGQTILITQGADGQQQCLLVTNEIGEMTADEQPSTSTANAETGLADIDETVAEGKGQEPLVAASVADSIHTPLQIKTDASEMEGIEDGVQDQVVAQVVRAEPPSPGGTHKVVVMLPDGNLMVTQVSPEEYASLELE